MAVDSTTGRVHLGGSGLVGGRHRGREYIAVFTDQALADRFVQHGDRSRKLLRAAIDTPKQWIALLEAFKRNGPAHIGFDRGPNVGPSRLFPVSRLLDEAWKELGPASGSP